MQGNSGETPLNDSISRAARVLVRTADARFVDPQSDPAPGTGHSLYVVIWHFTYADVHQAWTQERSAARRWATGDGTEWLALTEAQNMTDATRLLRAPSLQRPSGTSAMEAQLAESRPQMPRMHSTVGAAGLASPPSARNRQRRGMVWCSACIQPGMTEHSWASFPEHMIPSTLKRQAYSIRQGREDLDFDTRQSHFAACPVCGMGEAGAEHIWQWCTAAVMTWTKWRRRQLARGASRTMQRQFPAHDCCLTNRVPVYGLSRPHMHNCRR